MSRRTTSTSRPSPPWKRGYDGALLVISHDSDFLEAIGITREVVLGG